MKALKKRFALFLSLAVVTILSGCSSLNEPADTYVSIAPIVETDIWPENRFTAEIHQPSESEVLWVSDDSDNGRFTVALTGLAMEESEEYVEELKADGYRELRGEGNRVSVGLMLYRGDTVLSVAYADGSIVISIVLEA